MSAGLRSILLLLIGAGLVALIYLGSEAWKEESEHKTIRAMPEPERVAIFQRHKAEFDRLCGGTGGLQDYCEREAEFLSGFPECDETCKADLDRHIAGPSR